MKRVFCVIVVAAAFLAVVCLPAWAIVDYFSTKGLEKMSSNPQIVSSGVLSNIRSLTLNFNSQLGALLLGNNHEISWGELVGGAMNKGAEIYNTKAFDMFLGKHWDVACQEFLNSWNFGGLQLSANTKSQINNLSRMHFQQLGNLLGNISSSNRIIGDSGFPKIEKLTNQVDIKGTSDHKIR